MALDGAGGRRNGKGGGWVGGWVGWGGYLKEEEKAIEMEGVAGEDGKEEGGRGGGRSGK